MLLVSDATQLPKIYNRHANKSKHYITGSFGKDESLFNMQDSVMHAKYRKIAAPLYSLTNIKKMEPLIDSNIENWMARLQREFASTNKPFDFAPWAVFMAYDIISEVGFGAPFGFVKEENEDKRYFHVKEAGFGRYLVLAFVEKRYIEVDLLFLTTATTATSTIAAIIANLQK